MTQDGSSWRGLGTGVALGGVGVLLYLLIKNLGGQPGPAGRGTGPASTISTPLPPRPKDEKRLTFAMTQPTSAEPTRPMSFRGPDARAASLEEMVARVKAGGRSDVTLKTAGDVRHGSAESALALIKQAGIEVWKEVSPGVEHVSGRARGSYWSST